MHVYTLNIDTIHLKFAVIVFCRFSNLARANFINQSNLIHLFSQGEVICCKVKVKCKRRGERRECVSLQTRPGAKGCCNVLNEDLDPVITAATGTALHLYNTLDWSPLKGQFTQMSGLVQTWHQHGSWMIRSQVDTWH